MSRVKIRWAAVVTVIVALVVGAVIGMALQFRVDHAAPAQGAAPRCTDAIADAGGVCWGEPLPPCQTEDSDDCYWDAAVMGNGEGRSFYTEHGQTVWLDAEGVSE